MNLVPLTAFKGAQYFGAEPEPGAQPDTNKPGYGEAQPRLTSGGEAEAKILEKAVSQLIPTK